MVLIQIALGTSPPTATGGKCRRIRRRRAGAGLVEFDAPEPLAAPRLSTGGVQAHRSAYPATICFSSTFSARSAAFCAASCSADGVSDTTTPFRATERSTCHAEPSPNQSQLPHLNSCVTGPRWRGKSLHQARSCTTSARIGFHHFVLAAEFLQLDLFGEFPLPRRSGTHLSEDDNQFV